MTLKQNPTEITGAEGLPGPRNANEEAQAVLRGTEDGDLLDQVDLCLLQDVVNHGLGSLNEKGLAYWNSLVDSAVSGRYSKRWFCGVAGLTRDGNGYVQWKGANVEHYSYGVAHRQDMIDAARKLAAICTKVELSGRVVDGRATDGVYRDMDFAEGMQTPRFLVAWEIREEGPRIRVEPIVLKVRQQAVAEIAAIRGEIFDKWALASGKNPTNVRYMTVVSREDLASVHDCIRSDCEWAGKRFWPIYRNSEVLENMLKVVSAAVTPEALVTREQVQRHTIGDILDAITESSERILQNDSFETVRGERMTG